MKNMITSFTIATIQSVLLMLLMLVKPDQSMVNQLYFFSAMSISFSIFAVSCIGMERFTPALCHRWVAESRNHFECEWDRLLFKLVNVIFEGMQQPFRMFRCQYDS